MKEIFFTFMFAFIIYAAGEAQDNNNNFCTKADIGYVNITIGPVIPVGNFGNKDISNKSSGFAQTGYNFELNGGYHLTKSIDINAKILYSLLNYDVSNLLNSYATQYPATSWTSLGEEWELIGGLAGISFSHNFGKNFSGNVKILGGLMSSSMPEFSLKGSDGSTYTESKRSAKSFAYLFSVGGIYPIGHIIDLSADVEYLNASPTYTSISQTFIHSGNLPVINTSDFNQSIGLLGFNIGVRLKF